MIRAFYSSASGMLAQQTNIDTISNNIANINTVGYKKGKASFKDAMYTAIERRPQPVNLRLGNGTRVGAVQKYFHQGITQSTGGSLDIAIQGPGFFKVDGGNENILYTRDGNFKLSSEIDGQGAIFRLVTSQGHYVLDADTGQPISFRPYYPQYGMTFSQDNIHISEDGVVSLQDDEGNAYGMGRIAIVSFVNPQGLESMGDNMYRMPIDDGSITGPEVGDTGSKLMQGFLERSNVDILDEVTDLIMAQRAYQMSSRVLQTADEMERLANDLRG